MQIRHKDLLARCQGVADDVVCSDFAGGHGQEYADAAGFQIWLEGKQPIMNEATYTLSGSINIDTELRGHGG